MNQQLLYNNVEKFNPGFIDTLYERCCWIESQGKIAAVQSSDESETAQGKLKFAVSRVSVLFLANTFHNVRQPGDTH